MILILGKEVAKNYIEYFNNFRNFFERMILCLKSFCLEYEQREGFILEIFLAQFKILLNFSNQATNVFTLSPIGIRSPTLQSPEYLKET